MTYLIISLWACSEYSLHIPAQTAAGFTESNHTSIETEQEIYLTLEEELPVDSSEAGAPSVYEFSSDFDVAFALEIHSVDIAFLLDTTSSMQEEAAVLSQEFSNIAGMLSHNIDDAAYGFATYDDYNWVDNETGTITGDGPDKPFILRHQLTTEIGSVQDSLNHIQIHSGRDAPESTLEALYQGLTGAGYDQNSDMILQPHTDVPPFISAAGDAFNGNTAGVYNPSLAGTGSRGGFGFREGALPVIVYATDALFRDPEQNAVTPTSANMVAGSTAVVHAAHDLGARLIGIATQSEQPIGQMNTLAVETGSLYDANGDGTSNEPLVFTWNSSSENFRSTIVESIESLLGQVRFETVSTQVRGNPHGFAVDVFPSYYPNVSVGMSAQSLDFQVSISGSITPQAAEQIFPMTLEIYGDDTTLLGSKDITVIVPAAE